MFEKIFEHQWNGKFYKGYKFDCSVMDLIKYLQDSNKQILSVHLYEDADIGLKTFEGSYSLEKFLIKYSQINVNDIDSIMIEMSDKVNIHFDARNYLNLITYNNIDLNDYLNI